MMARKAPAPVYYPRFPVTKYHVTGRVYGNERHLVEKGEEIRMHHVQGTESFPLSDHARDADLTCACICISGTTTQEYM